MSRAAVGFDVPEIPRPTLLSPTGPPWIRPLNSVERHRVAQRDGLGSRHHHGQCVRPGCRRPGFSYNSSLVSLSGLSAIQINSALQASGWVVGAVNLSTPGTVRISMYSTEYSISATGPQNLLNLLFTVGSHAGVSPVTIDDSGSQSFTYLWNDDGQMSLTPQSGSITVNIGTTESGPTSDVEGTPVTYTSSIVGQTGTANYTWSVTRNGLPYNLSGVTTNAASLTFTPSDSGSYAVSLNVSDSASNTGNASQNLTVSDAPLTAVALTPPHAVVGQGLSNVTVFHFTNSTGNLDDLANYSAVVVSWAMATSR